MEETGKETVGTNHGTSKSLNLWLFVLVLAWDPWTQATFCANLYVNKQLNQDEDNQTSSVQTKEVLKRGRGAEPHQGVNFSNQNFGKLNVEVMVEPFVETIMDQSQDESGTTLFHSHVNMANQFMTNLLELDLWQQVWAMGTQSQTTEEVEETSEEGTTNEVEPNLVGPMDEQNQAWSETSFVANLVGPVNSRNLPWWKSWAEWNTNQTNTTTTTFAKWNASQTSTTTTGGTEDDQEEPIEETIEETLEEGFHIVDDQSQTASSSTSSNPIRRRVDHRPRHMSVPQFCNRCGSWGHHARACGNNSDRVMNLMNKTPCWRCRKDGDAGDHMMDQCRTIDADPDFNQPVMPNIVLCNRCHGFNHIAANCLEPSEITRVRRDLDQPPHFHRLCWRCGETNGHKTDWCLSPWIVRHPCRVNCRAAARAAPGTGSQPYGNLPGCHALEETEGTVEERGARCATIRSSDETFRLLRAAFTPTYSTDGSSQLPPTAEPSALEEPREETDEERGARYVTIRFSEETFRLLREAFTHSTASGSNQLPPSAEPASSTHPALVDQEPNQAEEETNQAATVPAETSTDVGQTVEESNQLKSDGVGAPNSGATKISEPVK